MAPALSVVTGYAAPDVVDIINRPSEYLVRVSVISLALILLTGALYWLRSRLLKGREVGSSPTWDCGYARPTARMQYTGSSFGEWIAFRLTPRSAAPLLEVRRPEGLFPREAGVAEPAPARDPLLLRLLEPFALRWARRFHDLHALQEGRLTIYLVYVLGTLVALLGWSAFRGWIPPR